MLLIGGAAVIGAFAWNATREQPVTVAMTQVARGEVRATVSNTRAGTVDACNRARMAPITGGRIAALPVAEGDRVEAGQILLELWNDDARAQLNLAEKERLAAVARADEACTAADVARREAARIGRLHEQGLTSEENADLAESNARAKAAACQATRRTIEVNDARVELARAMLEQTILRAPFAGTVAEINGEIGEVVTPSPVGIPTLPAVDLIDNSCIYVTAPIDEIDAPAFYLDLKAYRKSLAKDDTPYTGPVSLIRGLKVSVDMINDIGIETVWKRTAKLAEAVRTAAPAMGMRVFSQQPSDSVSGLLYPDGVDDGFRKELQTKYGASIAGGQNELKGKCCRISHMGYVDPMDTIGLIAAMEYTLADCGASVEIGKGVAEAVKVLRDWE
jgi:multidrug efflux pump subunit AcrA (membrane-fusion protein)